MEKKDIYEHLAKIYLDTPLRRPQVVPPSSPRISKKLIISIVALCALFIIAILVAVVALVNKNKGIARDSAVSHLLLTEAVKINYNFDPSKKAVYSFNLNNLNLQQYKTLEFSLRKSEPKDRLSIRVEFTNIFKEKSEAYLKDIGGKWLHFKINLTDFMAITDWSVMQSLSFIAEEWNVTGKEGSFYIDDVALLK